MENKWVLDLDYDYISMLGPPIRIGTMVKDWRDVYSTIPEDGTIDSNAKVGLIVEARLLGKKAPPVYWQYLVTWPDGMIWEDSVDLVTPGNWNKTYIQWLTAIGEAANPEDEYYDDTSGQYNEGSESGYYDEDSESDIW